MYLCHIFGNGTVLLHYEFEHGPWGAVLIEMIWSKQDIGKDALLKNLNWKIFLSMPSRTKLQSLFMNRATQIHRRCYYTKNLPVCVRSCILRSTALEYLALQSFKTRQTWIFFKGSEVQWSFECSFKFEEVKNDFPHWIHKYGRSPVCFNSWLRRWTFWMNLLPHVWHTCGRSPRKKNE